MQLPREVVVRNALSLSGGSVCAFTTSAEKRETRDEKRNGFR